jgi:hypothetical protein
MNIDELNSKNPHLQKENSDIVPVLITELDHDEWLYVTPKGSPLVTWHVTWPDIYYRPSELYLDGDQQSESNGVTSAEDLAIIMIAAREIVRSK